MAPLYIEKQCLICHGYQNYKLGQVRGGISVSFPVSKFSDFQKRTFKGIILNFSSIWLLGVIGLLFTKNKITHYIKEKSLLHEQIVRNGKEYRALFQNMLSGCIVLKNINNEFIINALNLKARNIEKLCDENLIGKSIKVIINEKVDNDIMICLETVYSTGDQITLSEVFFDNGKSSGWRK